MTRRPVRILALLVLTLLTVFAAFWQPAPAAAANWTFYACFTYFSSGPCRDVYRDSNGNLWLCAACGTTTHPSSKTCSRLTGSGFWCS